jgi:hypothetical protein
MHTLPTLPPLPFSSLPNHAQVWLYQTGQNLEPVQNQIGELLTPFTENWVSHGSPVQGAWAIYADSILMVAALEQQAGVSGCSTDGLVRVIQALSAQTSQDFFNRTACCLWGPGGASFHSLQEVKKGQTPLPIDTYLYFDISKNKLKDIRENWPIALPDSWIFGKNAQKAQNIGSTSPSFV